MQLAGEAAPGQAVAVGISDPADRDPRPDGRRPAATSPSPRPGTAERGAHILDPLTGGPATALASVTVVGPSLTYADAYATAGTGDGHRHASHGSSDVPVMRDLP